MRRKRATPPAGRTLSARRPTALAALLACALAAGACGDESDRPPPPPKLERLDVGRGPRSAAILKPAGRRGPLPGVIFLHGWGAVEPSNYGPWLRHLARRGSAVIYPRYQTGLASSPRTALPNALAGIRAALRRIPVDKRSVVVVGHSAGGALAADYAAGARRAGLPRPRAVLAVYPGRSLRGVFRPIPVVDPRRIAPGTRIVALAGADDRVVGSEPGRALVSRAARVARADRRFAVVRDPAVDDHAAPLRSDAAARATFWAPLDSLIAEARR